MNQLKRRVRIVHPFHPRVGEELELLEYRRSWGHECVDCIDAQGQRVSIPVDWTDAAATEDPFSTVSAGRCYLRVDDLLALVDLVEARKS